MTYFEKELHKILDRLADYGYVFSFIANSAYLRLPNVKIRIDFFNSFSIDNYDGLLLTAMNNDSGVIDKKSIRFFDVWGYLDSRGNPNFPSGVSPHIWKSGRTCEWYVGAPQENHYKILSEKIRNYIEIFE